MSYARYEDGDRWVFSRRLPHAADPSPFGVFFLVKRGFGGEMVMLRARGEGRGRDRGRRVGEGGSVGEQEQAGSMLPTRG